MTDDPEHISATESATEPTTWRVFGARVIGPSHESRGQACDDAFRVACSEDTVSAVVCDGAGSADHGGRGAELVANFLAETLIERFASLRPEAGRVDPDDLEQMVLSTVEDARHELVAEAAEREADLATFHTTVVGFLGTATGGLIFHLGDGAGLALSFDDAPNIAAVDDETPTTFSAPENGEYANETFFVTQDDWRDHLRFTAVPPARWIVLMSDGVTPFGLESREDRPAWAFLGPVLAFLDSCEVTIGSRAVEKMLDRPDARQASGDDKTLVLLRCLETDVDSTGDDVDEAPDVERSVATVSSDET